MRPEVSVKGLLNMGKKKSNGEGSIVKRKDGRYMARYTMDNKRYAIYDSTFEEVRVILLQKLKTIWYDPQH